MINMKYLSTLSSPDSTTVLIKIGPFLLSFRFPIGTRKFKLAMGSINANGALRIRRGNPTNKLMNNYSIDTI